MKSIISIIALLLIVLDVVCANPQVFGAGMTYGQSQGGYAQSYQNGYQGGYGGYGGPGYGGYGPPMGGYYGGSGYNQNSAYHQSSAGYANRHVGLNFGLGRR